MDVLVQDIKFAMRSLRRSPGYTAVVVAVMALGIGVNAMVFGMVYACLYRPLPLPESNRLVSVHHWDVKRSDNQQLSFLTLQDLRTEMKTAERVGGFWDHNAIVNFGSHEPERLYAATVTYDLFDALGVRPQLGHAFNADDEVIGKNWVPVVISDRVWKRRFGGTADVLGKPLRINGRTRTIVGVMPEGFLWPEIQDFWIPYGFDPKDEQRNAFSLRVAARLKPGATIEQANAEVHTIGDRLAKAYPKELEGLTVKAIAFKDRLSEGIRPMMLLLQGAVGFVLLIACANVANLMLARAAGRRREISLRMALGASRGRILRQLLTESVLVSLAGAVLGVLLAQWGNRIWMTAIPLEMPMWLDFSMDAPVLVFTAGISVLAGLLFGFAPAMHAGDARLSEALREGSAQAGSSRGRNRLRASLVVAEVALSLVLLVGAGLMIRSFTKRHQLQDHIQVAGVHTSSILMPYAIYPKAEDKIKFMHAVLPGIAGVPGVRGVAAIQALPLGRNGWGREVMAEGAKDITPQNAPAIRYGAVTPGYFSILGIPLKAGRDFQSTDTPTSQRVVIVSESLARKLWPRKDPLQRRLKFVGDPDSVGYATVVGVVGDALQNIEDEQSRLEMAYQPHDQDPIQTMNFVVRSDADAGTVSARVRQVVQSHDPDMALTDARTMKEHIAFSMWTHRLFTGLFATFAVLALIIAGVGIYGVMSYSVGQRTQEIGIRMALGADQRSVVQMVTLQAARLTGIGILLGLVGAYGVTRFMASQLFEVSPTDPPTFTLVCVVLAVSGIFAAWVPALRAARVDPMVALRCE